METTRQNKISRLLQKELSEIFRQETSKTHGVLVSVSVVRVSPDLSVAKAYLSIFPSEKSAEILQSIQSSAKTIRYELASRVRYQLRKTPELMFFLDDSLDYIENIAALLQKEPPLTLMPLALKISGRYLFSRKSHSAINLISLVSVLGVAVTTMAIICTLSVYNGFQDVVFSLCSRLDPPVKVEPVKGKTLDTRAPEMVALEGWRDEVAAVVPVVEENALAVFGNHQMPVFLKGVGENYAQVHTRLDETLLDGEFMLNDTAGCYIALGAGVASRLETGPFFSRPIRIYSPRRNVRVNMANPSSSFRERETFASAVFAVNQQEYDESWVLAPLALVRELYDYTTEASALELRLHDGVDEAAFAARLQEYLGDG